VIEGTWLYRTIHWRRRGFARVLPVLLLVLECLLTGGCLSDGNRGDDPTPTYTGPGELRSIESSAQMHLVGVAVGVGNIWEGEYQTADGTPRRGLTAGLFITVEDDASESRKLRVHPGLEVNVPGYRLRVLSVQESRVELALIEDPR
jgi:hypothetical protein